MIAGAPQPATADREPRRTRPGSLGRLDRLDLLRGVAMVWMTVFHFCFDLNHVGWIRQNFYSDPFWTWQRTAILSLFLLCAGAGQALAVAQGQGWPRFWRRWAQVAGFALLVSAGSYLMYPKSFIYFGVLHGIAVMLVIVRLTAHWGAWLWLCGALAVAAKFAAAAVMAGHPDLAFFNGKALNWLGLITVKPITEDYVPLIPWLGVMWWGAAAAQWMARERPLWLGGGVPAKARWLVVLGTWSLVYYMVHQPLMIGMLEGVQRLR